MDIDDKFLKCVDRWVSPDIDDKINKAIDKFELWINSFDDFETEILMSLLDRFNYHTLSNINNIIKELSDKSKEKYGVNNDNSIVSVIRKKEGKLGSSSEYVLIHRMVSGLSKKIYYDSLDKIKDEEWNNITNVIFIDDCSGTGKNFVDFLKRQKKNLLGKCIIFIVIEIMEEAKKRIDDYAKKERLNIQIIPHEEKKKAFTDMEDLEIQKFDELSRKQGVNEEYIRGYKNSESLMAFYNNTPNNTLGVFWFPSNRNSPIFPRELDKEPGWKQMNSSKSARSKQQYDAKRK